MGTDNLEKRRVKNDEKSSNQKLLIGRMDRNLRHLGNFFFFFFSCQISYSNQYGKNTTMEVKVFIGIIENSWFQK